MTASSSSCELPVPACSSYSAPLPVCSRSSAGTDTPPNVTQVELSTPLGETPLHIACTIHDISIDVIKTLLQDASDVNAKDVHGCTPLHYAAGNYDLPLRVLKIILNNKADIEASDSFGRTPLYSACGLGREKFVKALLKAGAKVESRDMVRRTPLHVAACLGRPSIIKVLLRAGADVKAIDWRGYTPLHYVAAGLLPRSRIRLLEGEERLEDYRIQNAKPFSAAQLLLQAGADSQAKTSNGLTPFHIIRKASGCPINLWALLQPKPDTIG